MFLLMTSIILIDQITKRLATYYLEQKFFISYWRLSTVYTYNKGISFSLLESNSYAFLLKYIVAIITLIFLYIAYNSNKKLEKLSLTLIASGGLSNFLDRVLFKGVIDFVKFDITQNFHIIFNFADIAITLGGILLAIHTLAHSLPLNNFDDKKT